MSDSSSMSSYAVVLGTCSNDVGDPTVVVTDAEILRTLSSLEETGVAWNGIVLMTYNFRKKKNVGLTMEYREYRDSSIDRRKKEWTTEELDDYIIRVKAYLRLDFILFYVRDCASENQKQPVYRELVEVDEVHAALISDISDVTCTKLSDSACVLKDSTRNNCVTNATQLFRCYLNGFEGVGSYVSNDDIDQMFILPMSSQHPSLRFYVPDNAFNSKKNKTRWYRELSDPETYCYIRDSVYDRRPPRLPPAIIVQNEIDRHHENMHNASATMDPGLKDIFNAMLGQFELKWLRGELSSNVSLTKALASLDATWTTFSSSDEQILVDTSPGGGVSGGDGNGSEGGDSGGSSSSGGGGGSSSGGGGGARSISDRNTKRPSPGGGGGGGSKTQKRSYKSTAIIVENQKNENHDLQCGMSRLVMNDDKIIKRSFNYHTATPHKCIDGEMNDDDENCETDNVFRECQITRREASRRIMQARNEKWRNDDEMNDDDDDDNCSGSDNGFHERLVITREESNRKMQASTEKWDLIFYPSCNEDSVEDSSASDGYDTLTASSDFGKCNNNDEQSSTECFFRSSSTRLDVSHTCEVLLGKGKNNPSFVDEEVETFDYAADCITAVEGWTLSNDEIDKETMELDSNKASKTNQRSNTTRETEMLPSIRHGIKEMNDIDDDESDTNGENIDGNQSQNTLEDPKWIPAIVEHGLPTHTDSPDAYVSCRAHILQSEKMISRAIEFGDLSEIEHCLESGAHSQVIFQENDRAKSLAEHPHFNHNLSLYLKLSLQKGNLDLVKYFILNHNSIAGTKDEEGKTYLHYAANSGHIEIMNFLINDGSVDINTQDNMGHTPLHEACIAGKEVIVKFLLKSGAQVDRRNYDGHTPLFFACRFGFLSVAKTLVESGCSDVNITSNSGSTPLHLAIRHNELECARYLIENCGAEFVRNFTGSIGLHIASMNGFIDIVKHLLQISTRGFDVDDKNYDDETALHIACNNGHLELVKTLIKDFNANVDARTNHGSTPLLLACGAGHLKVCEYLLDRRFTIAAVTDNMGRTPLHIAALHGRFEIVKLLVQCDKANIAAIDSDGYTAIQLAIMKEQGRIALYLSEYFNIRNEEDKKQIDNLCNAKMNGGSSGATLGTSSLTPDSESVNTMTTLTDHHKTTSTLRDCPMKTNLKIRSELMKYGGRVLKKVPDRCDYYVESRRTDIGKLVIRAQNGRERPSPTDVADASIQTFPVDDMFIDDDIDETKVHTDFQES